METIENGISLDTLDVMGEAYAHLRAACAPEDIIALVNFFEEKGWGPQRACSAMNLTMISIAQAINRRHREAAGADEAKPK